MKVWQLNSPNNLQRADAPDLELTEDKVKVKITKALLSEADVAVYSGATRVKYPVVPGRFAIGQVTEAAEDSYMKKGDRVYLAGVTEDECAPDGLRFAGETANGFYRDFVAAGADEAYVLPASVSDEAAFLIDAVAMAERVVDEMHVSVGQHILVVGGGLYGNVLCQILIYHRAVPILADNNAERLARAKKSGIYYTYPNDDTLKEHILQVTGGKLADAAVYLAFSNKSEPSTVFSLVAREAYVAYCAMTGKRAQKQRHRQGNHRKPRICLHRHQHSGQQGGEFFRIRLCQFSRGKTARAAEKIRRPHGGGGSPARGNRRRQIYFLSLGRRPRVPSP